MLKNKSILIIGGAGFVGSALAKKLINKNKVFVLDNYFTGLKSNHISKVVYKNGESIDIIKIFKKEKLDYVFHFGEYSRVEQSFEDIDKVIQYNTIPIYEVIKFCKLKSAKLIYSGSSTKFAKYDNKSAHSPYAWSKITNTNLINSYSKWFGLNYAITYFYNVYGDNEISEGKYSTVVGKFISLAKQNQVLPITRPGTQKRNFTHVDDIVNGLEIVALKGNGDGFGIGSNKAYSIIELANLIGGKIKFQPRVKGNRNSAIVKTEKIRKLGWRIKHKLPLYIKSKIN